MRFDCLTATYHAVQQKASRHRDTQRCYGLFENITAAILHQLLLGIFELLAFFA
jgi:hypothetical protein